jgi:predicted dehydrogenase
LYNKSDYGRRREHNSTNNGRFAGRNAEKARQFQKEFGFQKAYEGYEELLRDPEVEAVYIPLPNSLHAEWSIRALNSGKHVLCEKPLAVSETQVQEMFRAAEENGVAVCVLPGNPDMPCGPRCLRWDVTSC